MEDVTLNFECGRFIVAHIGYYVTEVLDIKKVHGAWYAILRGGTQQFRLPVSWQHNHPLKFIVIRTIHIHLKSFNFETGHNVSRSIMYTERCLC